MIIFFYIFTAVVFVLLGAVWYDMNIVLGRINRIQADQADVNKALRLMAQLSDKQSNGIALLADAIKHMNDEMKEDNHA